MCSQSSNLIRDYLNQQLRRATFFCWASVAAGLIGAVAFAHHHYLWPVPLVVAGVLYVVAVYYQMVRGRCPRCSTGILFALGSFGIHRSLPLWLGSCPSCGLPFDAQRDPQPV